MCLQTHDFTLEPVSFAFDKSKDLSVDNLPRFYLEFGSFHWFNHFTNFGKPWLWLTSNLCLGLAGSLILGLFTYHLSEVNETSSLLRVRLGRDCYAVVDAPQEGCAIDGIFCGEGCGIDYSSAPLSLRLGLRLKTYLNCFRSVLNCCILLSTPSDQEIYLFVAFVPRFVNNLQIYTLRNGIDDFSLYVRRFFVNCIRGV